MFLEGGILKSGCQHGELKAVCRVPEFSLCPRVAKGDRVAFWGLSYKGTDPHSWGLHPPKGPASWYHHLGGGSILTCEFWGGHSDHRISILHEWKEWMCVGIALLEKKLTEWNKSLSKVCGLWPSIFHFCLPTLNPFASLAQYMKQSCETMENLTPLQPCSAWHHWMPGVEGTFHTCFCPEQIFKT